MYYLSCPSVPVDGVCAEGWQVAEALQSFDLSLLDPSILGAAYAAGFTLVGVALVSVIGLVQVLKLVKGG